MSARFLSARLADLVALLAVLLLGGVLLLWQMSRAPGGVEWVAAGPGAQFHLMSRDGRLLIGVFTQRQVPTWSWGAASVSPALRELVNNDNTFFAADLLGFGIAVPHALLAGLLAILPVWWLIVHRDRSEELRRHDLGLCRHCGYDISHSDRRCPECGSPLAPMAFRGNGQWTTK